MLNTKCLWMVLIGIIMLVAAADAAPPTFKEQAAAIRRKAKAKRATAIKRGKNDSKRIRENAKKRAVAINRAQKKQERRERLEAIRAEENAKTAAVLAQLNEDKAREQAAAQQTIATAAQ
jgi:hypothetical protein